MKFNQLTVIEETGKNRFGKTNWLCKCDCGKCITLTTSDLTTNKRLSCGKCNTYIIQDGFMEFRLRNHMRIAFDTEDYPKLKPYVWFYSNGYIKALINGHWTQIHRHIMNAVDGTIIDHKDGNKLNNRKSNLRICTQSENQANRGKYKNNTSGYKGVRWNKNDKRWRAEIRVNGKCNYLGGFKDPISAAKAYNEAATKFFGEFALLNIIPSQEKDND